jgi:hypothetical protein
VTSQPDLPASHDFDTEDDRTDAEQALPPDADLDIIVAEVIDTDPEPSSPGQSNQNEGSSMPGEIGADTTTRVSNGDLSQQWHDIQAMFVDDPRGSVQLAAAAAETAIGTLVEDLQLRQAALAPPVGASNDPGDTEQLREALRNYRIFCQSLTDIGQQLPRSAAAAR